MTNFTPLHKTNFFKLLIDNFYFGYVDGILSSEETDFLNNIPVESHVKLLSVQHSSTEKKIILRSKSSENEIMIIHDISRENWAFWILGPYTPPRIGSDYLNQNILKYELKPRSIYEFENQVLLHICMLNPSFIDNEIEKIRTKCRFVSLGCFEELSIEPGIHRLIRNLIVMTSDIYSYLT